MKKADQLAAYQEQNSKHQRHMVREGQREQMTERQKLSMLEREMNKVEAERTRQRANDVNSIDAMMQEDKVKRQQLYRQMLQNQQYEKSNNGGVRGNMTQVEKRMNKEDLKAYKQYDNTNYALMPGIQNKKVFFDRTQFKGKGNTTFEEQKR